MIVYLSGINSLEKEFKSGRLDPSPLYALESFYCIKPWEYDLLQDFKGVMLDSGAFSVIAGTAKRSLDYWEDYVKKYIAFINRTKINTFVELDIDDAVGMTNVERFRKMIEDGTGKQPIVVWHPNRGMEYYYKMCEQYKYVGIGTTRASPIEFNVYRRHPEVMIKMLDIAHRNNAKMHGFGYTDTEKFDIVRFDSVDSTTWNSGTRFGELHYFNGKYIAKKRSVENKVKTKRLSNPREANVVNFKEWTKFQQYALTNL